MKNGFWNIISKKEIIIFVLIEYYSSSSNNIGIHELISFERNLGQWKYALTKHNCSQS